MASEDTRHLQKVRGASERGLNSQGDSFQKGHMGRRKVTITTPARHACRTMSHYSGYGKRDASGGRR